MIEIGKLCLGWRGWGARPRWSRGWIGSPKTSAYYRVLVGPLRIEWWKVAP